MASLQVMPANIDSVYFLAFDGWRNELRGNRWHFATRWARELPVVIVQPKSGADAGPVLAEADGRISGVECLSLPAHWEDSPFLRATRQAGYIASHMNARGHKKPLIWIYDPRLFDASVFLPAVGRIFHATENYFDFDGLDEEFYQHLNSALRFSDAVIAASSGVAAAYAPFVSSDIIVSSNGCDCAAFSGDEIDSELTELAKDWERLSVYAGNVNGRIDFELLEASARENPNTFLALFGPVSGLTADQAEKWKVLLSRNNVRAFGAVPPDRLSGIYKAAHVGIIPYRQDRLIAANGFPLKAFEMIATGLPVVSTFMQPLLPHAAPWFAVTDNQEDFLRAFGEMSRDRLDAQAEADMKVAASRQDYDEKFLKMRAAVLKIVDRRAEKPFSITAFAEAIASDWERSIVRRFVPLSVPDRIRGRLNAYLDRIGCITEDAIARFARVRPMALKAEPEQRIDEPVRLDSQKIDRPLNLLLMCDYHSGTASTIIDHIYGIRDLSRHNITVLSSVGDLPSRLDLGRFDGLIIHYSLVACVEHFISQSARSMIRNFRGLKVAFVQDDYRFIDKTVSAYRDLGIHILFGLAPEDIIDHVYSPKALPGVLRETVLAGYVPEHLTRLPVPSYADRPIDIGYRARHLPAWLGSHAQEKWIIAERVMVDAPKYNLRCDISTREADRIYGDRWVEFITSCKAMLGAESGSSVCDFTGEIQQKVEAHIARNPTASFELLRDLYFKDVDGRLMMNVISPRCFEAAALRTLMILYEGHYSGRLQPWRHYVPLRKDHSNMDEVVAVLRDPERAQEIIDRAFQEVALNQENWFGAMVRQMDRAIDARLEAGMLSGQEPYRAEAFDAVLRQAARRTLWMRRLQSLAPHLGLVFDGAIRLVPVRMQEGVRSSVRVVWRSMLGVETNWLRRVRTYHRLLRHRGPIHALRAARLHRKHPDMLVADLYVLSALIASGAHGLSINYDPAEEALDIVFGLGGGGADGISSVWLKELFRRGALKSIRWTVRDMQVIGMPGIFQGSLPGLTALSPQDTRDIMNILSWIFRDLRVARGAPAQGVA